jgi:hypothetical protein
MGRECFASQPEKGDHIMKMMLVGIAIVAALAPAAASAQGMLGNPYMGPVGSGSNTNSHQVSPYTTPNGTYVQPHRQTNPNNTQMDNYGTRGNYNPYTGAFGTRTPTR